MTDNKLGYHDLERMAFGFVLETETWPVFLEWVRKYQNSDRVHQWLEEGPSGYELRLQWMEHSSDPEIRAKAERLRG